MRNYLSYDLQEVFFRFDVKKLLDKMLLIRHFEMRAENAYQHGFIGGFFHSYQGQEAIQTAAVEAMGQDNWWTTSYRCHGLALLLGVDPQSLMSELYGKVTGNAKGRGGSMHLYTDRMLGGFGIVSGQVPIATGAAFQLKYKNIKDKVSVCFLGDGAVAQGAFHEALNMASLWNLPCIYVIENNQWGMGTAVEKAIAAKRLAEDMAPSYNMKGYSLDGMDLFACLNGFAQFFDEVKKTSRPLLVEAVCERFRGHSISDPGLYRTKEDVEALKKSDPIVFVKEVLIEHKRLDEEEYKEMNERAKTQVIAAMDFAEKSPWPDVSSLEEEVFAP